MLFPGWQSSYTGWGLKRYGFLPSLLDDFILDRGPEQALQDLQAIRSKAEPYLPWRDGGLAFAERLIKSQDLEDRLKATVAYLGAKGKVFALEWLKGQGIKGETRTALLQEAKEKLAQLQAQTKPSSQAEGDTPEELGPEYNEVKELLKPIITEYCLDKKGRLCRLQEKTVFARSISSFKKSISATLQPGLSERS